MNQLKKCREEEAGKEKGYMKEKQRWVFAGIC
jgi:hypothetical protein